MTIQEENDVSHEENNTLSNIEVIYFLDLLS